MSAEAHVQHHRLVDQCGPSISTSTRRTVGAEGSQTDGPDSHTPKFHFVQALRGFAALWVVLFHCSEGHHIEALKASLPVWLVVPVFDAGHYGVSIFFALSGFVIAHSLRNAKVNLAYLMRFILRRSVRLDPPYWASMVLSVGLAVLSARVVGKVYELPSFDQVVSHLFYLQEILGYPEISTVYWTLTYEVQFYLFLAGSFLLIPAPVPRMLLLTLIALLSAVGLFAFKGFFLPLWCCFFIGSLAYWAKADRPSLVAFFVLFATMMIYGAATHGVFMMMSAAAALSMYLVRLSRSADERFDIRWLQFAGTISYSLYLIHNPLTGASFYLTSKLSGTTLFANVFGVGIALTVCIAASSLFWWGLERPSQSLARRLSAEPPRA